MKNKPSLSPELQKLIQEQARKNKYDPDKDPVIIEFRRKTKKILEDNYRYRYNEPSNFGTSLMFLFIIMMFVMLLDR